MARALLPRAAVGAAGLAISAAELAPAAAADPARASAGPEAPSTQPSAAALRSLFMLQATGRCKYPLLTLAECASAADALGLGGGLAVAEEEERPGSRARGPETCSFSSAEGRVRFAPVGEDGPAWGNCSQDRRCICRSGPGQGPRQQTSGEVWYIVDWPEVSCPGGRGVVNITIWNSSFGSESRIPTFLRTSSKSVHVTFSLVSADGVVIFSNKTIELQGFDGVRSEKPFNATTDLVRRLSSGGDPPHVPVESQSPSADAEPWDSHGCEDFFLIDGRSPVDSPETVGEARAVFRDICEREGLEAFSTCAEAEAEAFRNIAGEDHAELRVDAETCSWLVAQVVGWDSLHAAQAVGRRLKGGSPSGRGWVYSRGRAGGPLGGTISYPRSAMRTAYPYGFYSASYGVFGRGSYLWTVGLPLTVAACAGAAVATHAGCLHRILPKTSANRDDLLELGFLPLEYRAPYTLAVTAVNGSDYTADCGASPRSMDLLFTLTSAEFAPPQPLWLTVLTLVLACLCMASWCCCCCGCPFFVAGRCFKGGSEGQSAENEESEREDSDERAADTDRLLEGPAAPGAAPEERQGPGGRRYQQVPAG